MPDGLDVSGSHKTRHCRGNREGGESARRHRHDAEAGERRVVVGIGIVRARDNGAQGEDAILGKVRRFPRERKLTGLGGFDALIFDVLDHRASRMGSHGAAGAAAAPGRYSTTHPTLSARLPPLLCSRTLTTRVATCGRLETTDPEKPRSTRSRAGRGGTPCPSPNSTA